MIKDLLLNVRDATVDKRLQPFVDEAKIASLLEQRNHGSPEEQQEAREQLARIAEALDEIGRSQVAYGIYEKYGNVEYMESAVLHAEQQRQLLQELGVDPGLSLNVDLRSQYKGSPLSACTYNPLQKDRSAVPTNEELRLAIALGLVNDKYREWAKTHYEDIEQAVKRAELQRELERQLVEYKLLNEPPTTLPDGTPITAENKRNDTTRAYYKEKVMDGEYRKLLGYNDWLEETYGMTEWRKTMDQTDKVINAFVGGFVESTVMAVVGTIQFGFNYVIDPEKMTREMVDKATYIFNNPDVIVEAAKTMYKNFGEGTPEEQAKMLGEAASVLVPGLQITKATRIVKVADKVANKVLDPISDAVKKVPDAMKNFEFPNLNPIGNQLIPETQGFTGPLQPWSQVWKVERNGEGRGGIEGSGKASSEFKYNELLKLTENQQKKIFDFLGMNSDELISSGLASEDTLKKILKNLKEGSKAGKEGFRLEAETAKLLLENGIEVSEAGITYNVKELGGRIGEIDLATPNYIIECYNATGGKSKSISDFHKYFESDIKQPYINPGFKGVILYAPNGIDAVKASNISSIGVGIVTSPEELISALKGGK
ncbi:hypothetical protein J7E73_08590 [Paenibacillus albidus]|uniref:hypothetical protein n=1 Tax=Paenibacillus albidus TaxID=2041023 RepID=UPI001BE63D51|nr:hypothetical protein [Paenibacillus albidus]MBT2289189.1 hypothetical protein [Paenibacillus albidus]